MDIAFGEWKGVGGGGEWGSLIFLYLRLFPVWASFVLDAPSMVLCGENVGGR